MILAFSKLINYRSGVRLRSFPCWTKCLSVIDLCFPQSLLSAVVKKSIVEGTRALLTPGLAYRSTSSLFSSFALLVTEAADISVAWLTRFPPTVTLHSFQGLACCQLITFFCWTIYYILKSAVQHQHIHFVDVEMLGHCFGVKANLSYSSPES